MNEKRERNKGQEKEKEKIEKKKRDKRERSIHKYFALKILGFFLRISVT
jgi:predicted Holliday junction resolvase-like endonuclease